MKINKNQIIHFKYFKKIQIADSLIDCFVAVVCFFFIHIFHSFFIHGKSDITMIAAFGASAALVFSSQIKRVSLVNALLVSGLAAIAGVTLSLSSLDLQYSVPLSIGFCVLLLNSTHVPYPPAGAIILIPILGNNEVKELGYLYILYPTMTGTIIIYFFAKLKEFLT